MIRNDILQSATFTTFAIEVGMKQESTGITNGTAGIVDFFTIWQDMVTHVNEHEVWFRALHPDRLSYSALVHCYGASVTLSKQELLAQSRLFHSGIVVLSTCICSTSCFQAHKHLGVVSFSLEVFATRCHLAGGHRIVAIEWSLQSATSVAVQFRRWHW